MTWIIFIVAFIFIWPFKLAVFSLKHSVSTNKDTSLLSGIALLNLVATLSDFFVNLWYVALKLTFSPSLRFLGNGKYTRKKFSFNPDRGYRFLWSVVSR